LSVHQPVYVSCKRNSSFTDESILMKLYTDAVYDHDDGHGEV